VERKVERRSRSSNTSITVKTKTLLLGRGDRKGLRKALFMQVKKIRASSFS